MTIVTRIELLRDQYDLIQGYVYSNGIRNSSGRLLSVREACYSIVSCWVDSVRGITSGVILE